MLCFSANPKHHDEVRADWPIRHSWPSRQLRWGDPGWPGPRRRLGCGDRRRVAAAGWAGSRSYRRPRGKTTWKRTVCQCCTFTSPCTVGECVYSPYWHESRRTACFTSSYCTKNDANISWIQVLLVWLISGQRPVLSCGFLVSSPTDLKAILMSPHILIAFNKLFQN